MALGSQYVRLSHVLPDLLTELIRGLQTASNLAPLLVAAYRAADAVAFKYGYLDLSARLIDLMCDASALTEDPLLAASTGYVRTEIFFATNTYRAGLRALESEFARLPARRARIPNTWAYWGHCTCERPSSRHAGARPRPH